MPPAKVLSSKPAEVPRRSPGKAGTEPGLRVPAVRKGRASSCPRAAARGREGRKGAADLTGPPTGPQGPPNTRAPPRRSRSSSAAPKPKEKWAQADTRGDARGEREPREVKGHSYKAFTVIPPDPRKRREIQRKAEAELAALEELRLSRAMSYVSINPSSVGGCLSLEEVRLKQQQEMMTAKRNLKPMKKLLVEETTVFSH